MILVIGEVLVDIFPDYKRIGGAPFNTAFHLHKFGFEVSYISCIGNDEDGKMILDFCDEHEFPVNNLNIDESNATGRVMSGWMRKEYRHLTSFLMQHMIILQYSWSLKMILS